MTYNLDVDEIKKSYLAGSHPKSIANDMEVSVTTIINRLTITGVYVRRKSPKKLNIDNKRIKRLYKDGLSSYSIAEEYDCGHMSILNRLKKLGVKRRSLTAKGKITKGDIAEIKNMRNKGVPLREIAKTYNVSFQNIDYHLKRS